MSGRLRSAVGACLLALASGCMLPVLSPGLRADLGGAGSTAAGELRPALHATAGVSAASVLHPKRGPPVDAGAGYVLSSIPSRGVLAQGAYLDGAWLHRLGERWRLSVGGRGEVLTARGLGSGGWGRGAAVRLALETARLSQGSFEDSSEGGCAERLRPAGPEDRPALPGEPPRTEVECTRPSWVSGSYHGVSGLGVSLEYGVRDLPGTPLAHHAMIGLTFRVPAAAILVWGLPGGDP